MYVLSERVCICEMACIYVLFIIKFILMSMLTIPQFRRHQESDDED